MKKKLFIFLTCVIITIEFLTAQISYPGSSLGAAVFKTLSDNSVILENNVIKMKFLNDGKRITIEGFEDKNTHEQLKIDNATALFELTLADNSIITSNEFIILNHPTISNIILHPDALTYADRLGGKKFETDFENKKLGLRVHWEADLRDGANYIRQIFTFTVKDSANISRITLLKFPISIGVKKEGTVDGSPIVHKNMFFAIEHPMSQVEQNKASLVAYMLQLTPVTLDNSLSFSTVWGSTPVDQMRRGFLYYIERERSNPYHQMLHYNSWYDISWADTKFNESQALDRIKIYRDSLINKRHVKLDAFLFDDGWDDNKTLWRFNEGFPNGFTKLAKAAESCNSSVGVWLSPFGGYGKDKIKRLEFGKKQKPPFETNANGFSLAGPGYYQRFLEVTENFIKDYNISMFKFDGVGPGNDASGAGIAYHNDIEAFLKLCKDLKERKPTLYLDLTTGTWASPYWLMYGDNIWRSGGDYGLGDEGSKRQRGITYRDAYTYKNVVKAGPLYPLNALMNGGIIIAEFGLPYKFAKDDKDISDDIWSFFGTGVNLQELYINPHYLNTANWNCLAKASNWARENERIMPDVHWVGGDPAKGEVYGYAAWSPQRAILMLRNPSNETKSFQVNVANVFELPGNVKNDYRFYDAKTGSKEILAQGQSFRITLQPFEVKVLNALPK